MKNLANYLMIFLITLVISPKAFAELAIEYEKNGEPYLLIVDFHDKTSYVIENPSSNDEKNNIFELSCSNKKEISLVNEVGEKYKILIPNCF